MNELDTLLVCTDTEDSQLYEKIKEVLLQSEITEFRKMSEIDEEFTSFIERIKNANICLFATAEERTKSSGGYGFLDFSINGVENDLQEYFEFPESFEKQVLNRTRYFTYKKDPEYVFKDKQIEERRNTKKIRIEEDSGEDFDERLLLLIRVLRLIELYINKGQYERAVEFCKESIEYIREDNQDDEEMYRKYLEDRLACLYWEEGESEETYQKVLKEYQKIVETTKAPARCPEVMLRCYNNLAFMHQKLKKYTQAKLNYDKASDYASKCELEKSDIRVQTIMHNTADVLYTLGDYELAAKKLEREKGFDAQYKLGLAQLELGKLKDAEVSITSAYKEMETNLGRENTRVIACKEKLATLYYRMEKYEQAEEIFVEILKAKKLLQLPAWDQIQTKCNLALVYAKLKDKKREKEIEGIYNEIRSTVKVYKDETEKRLMEEEAEELNEMYEEVRSAQVDGLFRSYPPQFLNKYIKPHRTEEQLLKIREMLEAWLTEERTQREQQHGSGESDDLSSYFSRPLILRIMNEIAKTYEVKKEKKRNFKEAEKRYRDIITKQSNGSRVDYQQLVNLYMAEGMHDKIVDLFEKKIREMGSDTNSEFAHIELARVYLEYEKNREAQGQIDILSDLMKDYVEVDSKKQSLYDLQAKLYYNQGKYKMAVKIYDDILQLRSSEVPENHNLRQMEKQLGLRFEDIDFVSDKEIEIGERVERRKRLDHEQREQLEQRTRWEKRRTTARRRLAEIHTKQEKYEEAEKLYRYNLRKAVERRDTYEIALVRLDLAVLYKKQGKLDEAEEIYSMLLESEERILHKNHPSLSAIRYALSEIREEQRAYHEAEELRNLAWESSQKYYGRRRPITLKRHWGLCDLYIRQKKYEKAKAELLDKVLPSLKEVFGDNNVNTLRAKSSLVVIYNELEDKENSRKTLAEIIEGIGEAAKEEVCNMLVFCHEQASLYNRRMYNSEAKLLCTRALQLVEGVHKHPEIDIMKKKLEKMKAQSGIDTKKGQKSKKYEIIASDAKLENMINKILNESLWYYGEVDKVEYEEEILKAILRRSDGRREQYKKLRLAKIYMDQEQYLKTIRMYYDVLCDIGKIEWMDEGVLIDTIQLLSKASLELQSEKNISEIRAMIKNLIERIELDLGYTNIGGIRIAKNNMNQRYILEKRYVEYALRQNNKAIKTDLIVENFLDIERIETKITPIVCIFGPNFSGKTVMIKILHACQNWSYDDSKSLDEWRYSKESFLKKVYQDMKEEEKTQGYVEKEINLLSEREKEFFDSKLKEMIEYQILSIATYLVDRDEDESTRLEKIWKEIVASDPLNTKFEGKNFFFKSEVTLSRNVRLPNVKVELDWKKMKLTVRISGDAVQLRMEVGEGKLKDAFYYYIVRRKNKENRDSVDLYDHNSTTFFVDTMSIAEIKTTILNILFECTPFVFFEGKSIIFPAHRSGLLVSLPKLTEDLRFTKRVESVSKGDGESIDFIMQPKSGLYRKLEEYHDKFLLDDKGNIIDYLTLRDYQADYQLAFRFKLSSHYNMLRKITKSFERIERMKLEVKRRENGSHALFVDSKHGGEEKKVKKTVQDVATSSLSLAHINSYVQQLSDILLEDIRRTQEAKSKKLKHFPTTVFYDEPGISLHPNHVINLFKFLFDTYQELNRVNLPLNLIFITHSPLAVDIVLSELVTQLSVKNIEDHYSAVEFTSHGELFKGKQVEIEDGIYTKNPFMESNKLGHKSAMNRNKAVKEKEEVEVLEAKILYQI